MSVHYRFKSALEYDTITFDGLHISVKDLKNAIIQQKRIGKSTDFDLRITNAQTQEIYEDENALIPKNTSLLIARIPVNAPKQKQWEGYGGSDTPPSKLDEGGPVGKVMDLASLDAPEDDKIKAMMSQSTQDYDPSNYMKIRGANQVGPVPASYRCYKCHQTGHWIKDCPLTQGTESVEIKKSTGIPQSFMVPVEGPQVPGAMMMANGQYAVPALDLQAYNQKNSGPAPVQEPKPEIPEDLLCSICSDLLADAVMIPCCGNSFCDECIRCVLLESEDHECPDCHEKDITPTTLIPNRFLRKSVASFKNTTGYEKKPIFRPKPIIPKEDSPKKESTPPPLADSTEKDNLKEEGKTVISEADSTEHAKTENDFAKDIELDPIKSEDLESDLPPGVSPKNSPIRKISSNVSRDRTKKPHKIRRSRTPSPRKKRNRRSSSFEPRNSPDRHTPTRDEPPGHGGNYHPSRPVDIYRGLPGEGVMQGGPPPMPGHMPAFPPNQPFPQNQPPFHPAGAPPNFRLPPPGGQPPPFMPPGAYPGPGPRPVYEPMGVMPGNFGPNYGGRSREYGGRRGRDRTPPGVIDDPLAAFNRILKEKDEKRARQQRMARRSWSRSRSRSRSFSRSPPPLRRRSRSPRRRKSRSRSRSFSIGRRRNERDRSEFERVAFRDKPRNRRSHSRDRFFDDRSRDYDRGVRNRGAPVPSVVPPPQQPQWSAPRDSYYPPPQDQPPLGFQNRFPQQIHHIQPDRKYEDIAPPGVEQPPIPGLESEPPPLNEFEKQKKSPHRNADKETEKESHKHSSKEHDRRDRDKDRNRERERDRKVEKRSRSKTRTPDKHRNYSPKSSGTPEKPKKRRISSDSREDKKRDNKDRNRDHSEDEKKRNKDKKKHKEKKDDKKKRRDKKEKHKSKDKKDKKEEFKQVIPKGSDGSEEDPDEVRRKIEERKKQREEEENRKQQEERKKEERRLRFLEDEKRKREEEARKEEIKRRAIEEARRLLEEEERQRLEKQREEKERKQREIEHEKLLDLYDEVIPEQDFDKEIRNGFNKSDDSVAEIKDTEGKSPNFEFPTDKEMEEGEVTDDQEPEVILSKEGEDHDPNILELHSDLDIKLDESDILAPVPEKSKWEVEDEGPTPGSPLDTKESIDSKSKVSSDVIKRAENVIFARAINSIRPLDTKKNVGDRIKIHIDEKSFEEPKKVVESVVIAEKPRLSIKDRLGKKVDEPDPKVVVLDRRTPSPFNRRDRKIEVEAHRRHDKKHSRSNHDASRDRHRNRRDRSFERYKKTRRDEKDTHEERAKDKRKRTLSRSESEEHKKKKKDKKIKKEKPKKHEEEHKKDESLEIKTKSTVERRKPTLDEANFEPDYDLELHEDEFSEPENETKKSGKSDASEGESSSAESSSSSSEEERRKKKRKARKKKKRRETSSSESESSSDSSDSEKDRKRKRHKKTKKKKKKSRHK